MSTATCSAPPTSKESVDHHDPEVAKVIVGVPGSSSCVGWPGPGRRRRRRRRTGPIRRIPSGSPRRCSAARSAEAVTGMCTEAVVVGDGPEGASLLEVAEVLDPCSRGLELRGAHEVGVCLGVHRARHHRGPGPTEGRGQLRADQHAGLLRGVYPESEQRLGQGADRADRGGQQRQPPVVAHRCGVVASSSGNGSAAATARRRTAMVQPVVRARFAKSSSGTTGCRRSVRPTRRVSHSWATEGRPSSPIRSASEKTMVTVGSCRRAPDESAELRRVPDVVLVGERDETSAAPSERRREVGGGAEPLLVHLQAHLERCRVGEAPDDLDRVVVGAVVLHHELVGQLLLGGDRLQQRSEPPSTVVGRQGNGEVQRCGGKAAVVGADRVVGHRWSTLTGTEPASTPYPICGFVRLLVESPWGIGRPAGRPAQDHRGGTLTDGIDLLVWGPAAGLDWSVGHRARVAAPTSAAAVPVVDRDRALDGRHLAAVVGSAAR